MSIVNIIKEPEYYYPAGMAEQDGLMTYQEYQKLNSIPTPSNIVTKSSTAGLLKNDGTVDTNSYVKESDIELEKTATGNPITLTDAVAGNAIEVSAEIVASQDLHGYDKPWVGGAGINKLPLVLADIKSTNTSGTWTGNSFVKNGITFEVLTDSADNVLGVNVNGTASADVEFYVTAKQVGNNFYGMKINGAGTGTSINLALLFTYLNGQGAYVSQFKTYNNAESTISTQTDLCTVSVFVARSQTVNNLVFYPMISANGGAFEPYTNICPISGFSSVVITDVDAESQTATVTVSLGQTVYGGTLDLTSGELTITHANIASYNGETIGEPWISSMDEYTEGGTPTTGAQVVYTLAAPTTTTLTAEQLALVKGYNQLTCNSGDMEITYKASGLDALKERVDELEDAVADIETDMASKTENSVVGNVENNSTASQAYAVGEHFIRNDKFCTAIAAIASGATLTLNTNYVEGTIAEALTPVEGTTSVSGLKYIKQGNIVFISGRQISLAAGTTVDVTGLPAPYNDNYALAQLMYGGTIIGYLQYSTSALKWTLSKVASGGTDVGAISLTYISKT